MALKAKGPPDKGSPDHHGDALLPWFEIPGRASRATRIIFGHWSTLGYVNAHGVIGLDTGCVWGGSLTAVNLDEQIRPISVPVRATRNPASPRLWAYGAASVPAASQCTVISLVAATKTPRRQLYVHRTPHRWPLSVRPSVAHPRTSTSPTAPRLTRNATRTGHARPPRGITTAEPVPATADMSRTTSLRCQNCGHDRPVPSGAATVNAVDTSGAGGARCPHGRCADRDAQPARPRAPTTSRQAERAAVLGFLVFMG